MRASALTEIRHAHGAVIVKTRHVSAIELAPFTFMGLRVLEMLEAKNTRWLGKMKDGKTGTERKRGEIPPLEPRECKECHNIFVPKRRNQVVCSDECRFLRARKLSRETSRRRKAGDLSPRPCVVCGEIFTPKRTNERCCSEACKGTHMLENCRRNMLKSYYGIPSANTEKRRAFLVDAIAAYTAELEKIDAMIGNKQPESREEV